MSGTDFSIVGDGHRLHGHEKEAHQAGDDDESRAQTHTPAAMFDKTLRCPPTCHSVLIILWIAPARVRLRRAETSERFRGGIDRAHGFPGPKDPCGPKSMNYGRKTLRLQGIRTICP